MICNHTASCSSPVSADEDNDDDGGDVDDDESSIKKSFQNQIKPLLTSNHKSKGKKKKKNLSLHFNESPEKP